MQRPAITWKQMQLGLRKNTHSQYFFNLFCNSMQKNAPICGAFKEFHTVLQLQIPNYNFNVASILIWSSPIILLENEIMMQHSRRSVCSSAIFKEKLFSACCEKNPVTYTSSKFFVESSILTEWGRNPWSNWDAHLKGRNKMERHVYV